MRSGMMQNGIVYPLQPLAHLTRGTESGLWLTPNCMDALPPRSPEALKKQYDANRKGRTTHSTLREQVVYPPPAQMWQTPTSSEHKFRLKGNTQASKCLEAQARRGELQLGASGALNPAWVEWLMGFPAEWTELNNLETQSSLKSQS